ncbi:MAG: hypothetical protein DRJ67_09020 [Thermoprotei archaeon]|nr:MAG: hypothetical protein DRJ67_09020 [Thermoprotei archaeon]
MTERRVRLRFSGLIAFTAGMISTLTGFLTVVLVTRNITLYEYGLWYLFSQYVSLTSAPLLDVVNFWALRDVARGYPVARTALLSSLLLASASSAAYVALILWAYRSFSQPLSVLLLGVPQIFVLYIVSVLTTMVRGYAPHFYGVAQMVFEFSKVALVYVALAVLKQGLLGVIVAVMAAYLMQAAFSAAVLSKPLRESRASLKRLVRWVKLGWVPLYQDLHHILLNLEPVVVRALRYSEEVIGIRSMSVTLSSIVMHASSLGVALYPKILRSREGPRGADIEVTLKLEYMLAIPLSVGIVMLAPDLLLLFGRNYLESLYGVWVAAACFLVAILGMTLDQVIMGAETLDLSEGVSMRAYAKSLICRVITINVGRAATGVAVLAALLYAMRPSERWLVAVIWNAAWLATLLPFEAYKYLLARKLSEFRFPLRNIVRYAVASALMALLLKAIMAILGPPPSTRITGLACYLTLLVTPTACLYLMVVCLIDPFAQSLAKAALNVIKSSVHGR